MIRKSGGLFWIGKVPDRADVMIHSSPALQVHDRYEEVHQHNTGLHLSWDGKVPVRADRLYNHFKSKLRKNTLSCVFQLFADIFDFYDR